MPKSKVSCLVTPLFKRTGALLVKWGALGFVGSAVAMWLAMEFLVTTWCLWSNIVPQKLVPIGLFHSVWSPISWCGFHFYLVAWIFHTWSPKWWCVLVDTILGGCSIDFQAILGWKPPTDDRQISRMLISLPTGCFCRSLSVGRSILARLRAAGNMSKGFKGKAIYLPKWAASHEENR